MINSMVTESELFDCSQLYYRAEAFQIIGHNSALSLFIKRLCIPYYLQ